MDVTFRGYACAHDFRKSGRRFRAALNALQRRLGIPQPPRRVGDTHHRDPCVRDLTIDDLEGDRDTRQREVAKAARDFFERPAGVRCQNRNVDLKDNFFRIEAIRESRYEEVFGRDVPATMRPLHLDRCRVEHRKHRQFRGRVRVRQASADRTLVADGEMRHVPHGGSHDRQLRRDQFRKFKIGMPGHGANGNPVAPEFYERHSRNMHQIDNKRRTRHPEVQQRHQRLPSGQYLAVSVRRGESRDRRFAALWSDIVESGWLHFAPLDGSLKLTFALRRMRATQHPLNRGALFSAKARLPSLKSSLSAARSIMRWAAAMSRAPSPMDKLFNMNFAPAIDSGALRASVPAKPIAPDTASLHISSTSPIAC